MSRISHDTLIKDPIADLILNTRTLRAKAVKIIPPHEIEVSEGVSIFVKGRKIKRLMAIEERIIQFC